MYYEFSQFNTLTEIVINHHLYHKSLLHNSQIEFPRSFPFPSVLLPPFELGQTWHRVCSDRFDGACVRANAHAARRVVQTRCVDGCLPRGAQFRAKRPRVDGCICAKRVQRCSKRTQGRRNRMARGLAVKRVPGIGKERREKCMGHRVQRVSHGYRVQCPEPRPQGHRPTEPIVPLLCSSAHFRCVLPLVSHQSFSLAFVRFATEPLRFEYPRGNK